MRIGRPARNLALGGMVICAALGFLVYQGLSNNLVYYITPSELLAKGIAADRQSFRLGGQVRPGSIHFNHTTDTLRFILQDPKGAVQVISHGLPPPLFQPGGGAVVEGTYARGIFAATTLMIKHSNQYRAPQPGQTPVPDNFATSP